MQINKAILLPLLTAIATFVKQGFGYEIPNEYLDYAANLILLGVTVAGIFIHPKKTKPTEVTDHAEYPAADDAV